MDWSYSYADANGHNNGNVAQMTDNTTWVAGQTFTYDSLNRLATAQTAGTFSNFSNCWSEVYNYDSWGTKSPLVRSSPAPEQSLKTANPAAPCLPPLALPSGHVAAKCSGHLIANDILGAAVLTKNANVTHHWRDTPRIEGLLRNPHRTFDTLSIGFRSS